MTTAADGTGTAVLSTSPFGTPESVQWAPDGRSILVVDADMRLTSYFLDGSPPAILLNHVHLEPDAFRPPDGPEVLYEREDEPGTIYALRLEDAAVRQLFSAATAGCECEVGDPARWSPDGSKIAVTMQQDGVEARMYVMNADGTGLRQLAYTEGTWFENDPRGRPTGHASRSTAGSATTPATGSCGRSRSWRCDTVAATPIGVRARVGGGAHRVGAGWREHPDAARHAAGGVHAGRPARPGRSPGRRSSTSPDGTSRQLDWSVGSIASWQRVAP